MTTKHWEGVMYTLLVIFAVVALLLLVFMGASLAGRAECEALGFEWGIYDLGNMQVECEYRLRVPLREVLPPIDEGGNDELRSNTYIPSTVAV